ncbi:hypothetical protein, partial [Escherichia coli]|uniref:hypothetical protein n=1 Tax=Escherichia coli TaxID=562 RepID=UPI00207D2507
VRREARGGDHLAPFFHLLADRGGKTLRRAARDLDAEGGSAVRTSGASSAALISRFSLGTISRGVPAGARMQPQILAS